MANRTVYLKIPLYPPEIGPTDLYQPYIAHLEAKYLREKGANPNPKTAIWHQGKPLGILEQEHLEIVDLSDQPNESFPVVRITGLLKGMPLEGGLYFPFTQTEVEAADPHTLSTPKGYFLPVNVYQEAIVLGQAGHEAKHLLNSNLGKALHQRLKSKLHNLAGTLIADYPTPGVLVVDLSHVQEFSEEVAQQIGPALMQDLVLQLQDTPDLELSVVFKGHALLLEYAFSLSPTVPAVVYEGSFRFLGVPKGIAQSLGTAYNNLPKEGHRAMLRKIATEYPWLLRKRVVTNPSLDGHPINTDYQGVISKHDLENLSAGALLG